mmetsp:Transcript_12324/g.18921  ORF Transcript_12324/g.18921 Transcript_12324/m.18921 type:complete len:336 (+) Transcript_12324:91-1098(+)|eukprot:CAMPEP_0178920084 /NCGR_PEP_ID=MMETSP0786-20121207/14805_1 /TAXON_ID=186022 /ORGANISM="Thalassionema frauenfeldii, Strain CCMP 1798" /LENGTH=335 /DNA_ID=CAMNT_0020594105 /DNA_START=30 /DNA_END=1037 /DNA_ORIENTATION=+
MAGVNKIFIMLPMIFAVRKLDADDPNVVYWLRVAYFGVQTIIGLLVMYIYLMSSRAIKGHENRLIYVPQPAQPFAPPDAKKKYTETTFGAHVSSQVLSLLGSTFFGILLTSGLHFYRGMVVGLAMQSVMGPLNIFENALVKALVLKKKTKEGSWKPEDKIFDEKFVDELNAEDEVVDKTGSQVVRKPKTFEEILLDVWDSGAGKADITPLMDAINKENCNFKTKDSGWTPIMILSGIGVKGSASAIRQVISLGGNPAIADNEGWNAMHWAAFHGSVEAAKLLIDEFSSLSNVKDKEGKKPLELAEAEGNEAVANVLKGLEPHSSGNSTEGLRKRK